MASTVENGQTCLEKRGMEERHQEITRSDYNIENQYGPTHIVLTTDSPGLRPPPIPLAPLKGG